MTGLTLGQFEELIEAVQKYKETSETLNADLELVTLDNASLRENEGKMLLLIEELEKTVSSLNYELTQSENLIEEREAIIHSLTAQHESEIKKHTDSKVGTHVDLEEAEEEAWELREELRRLRAKCQEQKEIISDYETAMTRQDEYIFALSQRLDKHSSRSPRKSPNHTPKRSPMASSSSSRGEGADPALVRIATDEGSKRTHERSLITGDRPSPLELDDLDRRYTDLDCDRGERVGGEIFGGFGSDTTDVERHMGLTIRTPTRSHALSKRALGRPLRMTEECDESRISQPKSSGGGDGGGGVTGALNRSGFVHPQMVKASVNDESSEGEEGERGHKVHGAESKMRDGDGGEARPEVQSLFDTSGLPSRRMPRSLSPIHKDIKASCGDDEKYVNGEGGRHGRRSLSGNAKARPTMYKMGTFGNITSSLKGEEGKDVGSGGCDDARPTQRPKPGWSLSSKSERSLPTSDIDIGSSDGISGGNCGGYGGSDDENKMHSGWYGGHRGNVRGQNCRHRGAGGNDHSFIGGDHGHDDNDDDVDADDGDSDGRSYHSSRRGALGDRTLRSRQRAERGQLLKSLSSAARAFTRRIPGMGKGPSFGSESVYPTLNSPNASPVPVSEPL